MDAPEVVRRGNLCVELDLNLLGAWGGEQCEKKEVNKRERGEKEEDDNHNKYR